MLWRIRRVWQMSLCDRVTFSRCFPKKAACFVEQGTPGLGGFNIEKKMGLKAYESTSFNLDDVRVPAANLLGGEERYQSSAGFKTAMRTFNAGRPIIAANAVGMARAALDETIRFARERDLLGESRVRDRIESIARKVRKARLVCLRAGWLAQLERPNIIEASMSKALAAQIAQESTSAGLEILGAYGARGDHLIEEEVGLGIDVGAFKPRLRGEGADDSRRVDGERQNRRAIGIRRRGV